MAMAVHPRITLGAALVGLSTKLYSILLRKPVLEAHAKHVLQS
jgi:hypothetical protein